MFRFGIAQFLGRVYKIRKLSVLTRVFDLFFGLVYVFLLFPAVFSLDPFFKKSGYTAKRPADHVYRAHRAMLNQHFYRIENIFHYRLFTIWPSITFSKNVFLFFKEKES